MSPSNWILALAIFHLPVSANEVSPPAEDLLQVERPLVIAHRGDSGALPENTLPAFESAIAAQADLIEFDYHHSKDGHPIVIHDPTLDRTTNARALWGGRRHPVASYPLAELQKLDAGAWFNPPHPGLRLPTLGEALDVIQGNNGVALIEHKVGDAAACARLIRDRELINHVVVQSFDWNFLRDYRAMEPNQILGAIGPPKRWDGRKPMFRRKRLSTTWLDEIQNLGMQIVVWNHRIDAASVRAANDRGLKVWVYTINEAKEAARLIEMGVDGIITDYPAKLRPVIIGDDESP